MTKVLWAIIKKEILVAVRDSKLQVVVSIVLPTILQCSLVQKYMTLTGSAMGQNQQMDDMLKMAPTMTLLYVAPILIPLLASTLLIKSFIQEKVSGALMPILATGLNVGVLWAGKTFAVFSYCYLISLFILGFDVLMMIYYFKLKLFFTFTTVLVTMVISPIIALAITAILSFLYWTVRFGNILGSFLPILAAGGLYSYGLSRPSPAVLLHLLLVISIISALILFLCGFTISKMSRARILGL